VAVNSPVINSPTASNGANAIETPKDFGDKPEDQASYWIAQDKVAYDREQKWIKQGRGIIDRYRDKRKVADKGVHRYNVLWSNVQTLRPAIFARAPKPEVDRRFDDQDPVARLSAELLERALSYLLDMHKFDDQMRGCVDDLLLPGRGVMRALYTPHYGDAIPAESDDTSGAPEDVDAGEGYAAASNPEQLREVVSEDAYLCYVFWEDYREGPARKWEDVPWVRFRAFMTRQQLTDRFQAKGKLVNLDSSPHNEASGIDDRDGESMQSLFKKAEIWEIWDKTQKRVLWVAPGSQNLGILDQVNDPLGLQGFFPNADPLLATTTTDTRIPVPDYVEYQDQASELDNITRRIDILLKALKVSGVYAGSEKQVLQQLIGGDENKLIAVDDWAQFMTDKGGIQNLIQFMPIQQVAETLIQLYNARDRCEQVLYQITGMADIMRGSSDPNETATAQQIKAQFGTMRLNDRQRQVANFARDNIRLLANVIAGQFSPQALSEITGYPKLQPMPQPPAGLQPTIMDPQTGQPAPNPQFQQFQQKAQEIQGQNQKAQADFMAACQLLKDDMPHGYRIDIEADSTIMPDEQQEKQSKIEFVQAFTPFLQQAIQGAMALPITAPLSKELTLFLMRGFKVSRPLEEQVEKLFDQMAQMPPQPQGQDQKPQDNGAGDMAKAQADVQGKQIEAQTEQQRIQSEAQTSGQQTQADAATKLQIANTQAQVEAQNNQANQAIQLQKLHQDGAFRAADLQLKERDQEMRAEALRTRELKNASAEASKLQ
jgi:hypothetical protein